MKWLDLHVYTRGSLGISTDCSKKDLQAGDKEEEKKTTTNRQTWTMWTRTTLKMNFQWVLWCSGPGGGKKKGGSSAEIQLYIVPGYGQAGQATLLLVLVLVLVLPCGSGQIMLVRDVPRGGTPQCKSGGGWMQGGEGVLVPPTQTPYSRCLQTSFGRAQWRGCLSKSHPAGRSLTKITTLGPGFARFPILSSVQSQLFRK